MGFGIAPGHRVQSLAREGFRLNVLVAGETGLGKSTLVDCLFGLPADDDDGAGTHSAPEVTLRRRERVMIEGNVRLVLGTVETEGLGDQLDRGKSGTAIADYVDRLLEQRLEEEIKAERRLDGGDGATPAPGAGTATPKLTFARRAERIHVCLYLVAPTTRALKAHDRHVLQLLHRRVSLLPVIAKADTVTDAERAECKAAVADQLRLAGIECYTPHGDTAYAAHFPLAVVASRERAEVGGRVVPVRRYPWGVVDAEDPGVSDLARLRQLLLRERTAELVFRSEGEMFERYRLVRLTEMGFGDADVVTSSLTQSASELEQQELALRQKFLGTLRAKQAEIAAAEHKLSDKYNRLRAIHLEESSQIIARQNDCEVRYQAWCDSHGVAPI